MGGRGVTGDGASHHHTSTPAVAPTTFFGFSRLPQELKDEIHEWVLMDKVRDDGTVEIMGTEEEPSGQGTGRSEASLWAFTETFEPLKNQDEFVAASRTMAAFLRRHTSFKATCAYLDLSVAEKAWSRYIALKALLSPSRPFHYSFHLIVKTCDLSDSENMVKAAAWFFWEAMRQWRLTQKSPGTMLLRAFELPVGNITTDRLYPESAEADKLQALLNEMRSIPGLSDNPEEMLVIAGKFHRMLTWSKFSGLRGTQAVATWRMNIFEQWKQRRASDKHRVA